MKSKSDGSTKKQKSPKPIRGLGTDPEVFYPMLKYMKERLNGLLSPEGPSLDVCINDGRFAYKTAKSLLRRSEAAHQTDRESGKWTEPLEAYTEQAIEFYLDILGAAHEGMLIHYELVKNGCKE